MKTSLHWLNDYLDQPIDADEAEQLLTDSGFPFDGRDDVALSAGGSDVLLDVEVTSNRSDCLSHLGLARELVAASDRNLQPPDVKLPDAPGTPAAQAPDVTSLTSVTVDCPDTCPVYTARVIDNIKIGPSPDWLIGKLEAVGLRPVNNVVDITNFVLLELGQPLHAFDMDKLAEHRIVVRNAAKGEPFVAIDGSKHALDPSMMVIADASKPVAIAGVMGGLESEVSDSTTRVLLESATFDPLSVRTSSRRLKLASDSSYRFERGVDPLAVEQASRRAAALMVELAGGTLTQGVIRIGADEPSPEKIAHDPQRCRDLLGVDLTDQQQADLLDQLHLSPEIRDGQITCTVPTYRLDLTRPVDLIEEVARLYRLDRIPVNKRISIDVQPPQPKVAAKRRLADVLESHGYFETVNFSFVSEQAGKPFLPAGSEPVLIDDERRKAEPMLRPSVLPSLLRCRKLNQDAGNQNVKLYETAQVWCKRDGQIIESSRLGMLADAPDAEAALRSLRGVMTSLIEQLAGAEAAQSLQVTPMDPADGSQLSPGGGLSMGDSQIGTFGLLAKPQQDQLSLTVPVVVAELDVAEVFAAYPPAHDAVALAKYPGIDRDLSLIVDEAVTWQAIDQVVAEAHLEYLTGVSLVGLFRGKPITRGSKSVSLRLHFQNPDRTLRHDEVDPQIKQLIDLAAKKLDAQVRTA